MLVRDIKAIARQRGINTKKMKKADLVRSEQLQEGNDPCFQTGRDSCDQGKCLWRPDCLKD